MDKIFTDKERRDMDTAAKRIAVLEPFTFYYMRRIAWKIGVMRDRETST